MSFKPLSKKYIFDDTLSMDIPAHLKGPIANWLELILQRKNLIVRSHVTGAGSYVSRVFKDFLQVQLREVFPQQWGEFLEFVINDTDRCLTLLQICLNKFADNDEANRLEIHLSMAGSGYEVEKVDKEASSHTEGVYDLIERVPSATKEAAKNAISENDQLLKAWRACYGRGPNYKEAVQQAQNVLESLFRDNYLPNDKKAQLGKLIADIKAGKELAYKGSDVLTDPNVLLGLVDRVPEYRGVHTAGSGKVPTKQQAEYILHTTIYLWNLHQK